MDQSRWPSLQGPHNAQNALAAIAVAQALGVDEATIDRALESFRGLPHRMERLGEVNGVSFVNDSKATNPESAAPALAAFNRVHWIVGGKGKGADLDACLPHLGHVVRAYTIGASGPVFARALDGMRDALEGRKYAERYIHTLTHEMKSPLAAIRGAAELLDEDMPREASRKFIGNIRAESARTERLINRLLELAAIESRASLDKTSDVNMVDIVRQAVDQVGPLADVADVKLRLDLSNPNIRVRGDAFILRAAVTNLLENAVDFSPSAQAVLARVLIALAK
jgi:signal transduction histidine kinase